jgi:hypothetical protein
VTHIEKVTNINSGNFDISTQSTRLGKVICDWNADQKELVAKLNTGNTISVIGKLDVYKDYSYGYYNFKIKYFEIP